METQTKSPDVLNDHLIRELDGLRKTHSWQISSLESNCRDEIKHFKEKKERELKFKIETEEKKHKEEHYKAVDNYLTKLLAPVHEFGISRRKISREQDEILIAILNAYNGCHGYFIFSGTLITRQSERDVTKLYRNNITRWRRLFGSRKIIAEPLGHFLSRIPRHINFSTLLGKEERGKRKEPVTLYHQVNKFRAADENLDKWFIEIEKLQRSKPEIVRSQQFEKAAQLRDETNALENKILYRLKKLLPAFTSDQEILSVIREQYQ